MGQLQVQVGLPQAGDSVAERLPRLFIIRDVLGQG